MKYSLGRLVNITAGEIFLLGIVLWPLALQNRNLLCLLPSLFSLLWKLLSLFLFYYFICFLNLLFNITQPSSGASGFEFEQQAVPED